MNTPVLFDSASVSKPHRMQYWSDVVSKLAGDVDIDPFGAETLDGNVEILHFGRLRFSRIHFSRFRVALRPTYKLPRSGFEIMFQSYGRSYFEQDGRQIIIGPGECLAFDNSRPFVIESEAEARVDLVDIPSDIVSQKGLPHARLAGTVPSDASIARVAYGALELVRDEMALVPEHAARSMAAALVDFLLLPFATSATPAIFSGNAASARLRVKTFISENLSDPMLSVGRIADAIGCTKRYLHMLFEEEGTTLSRYIWRMRVQKCKETIENSLDPRISITDVAFSWGFSSSSHFSRLFKNEFGVLPSSFKRGSAHKAD